MSELNSKLLLYYTPQVDPSICHQPTAAPNTVVGNQHPQHGCPLSSGLQEPDVSGPVPPPCLRRPPDGPQGGELGHQGAYVQIRVWLVINPGIIFLNWSIASYQQILHQGLYTYRVRTLFKYDQMTMTILLEFHSGCVYKIDLFLLLK